MGDGDGCAVASIAYEQGTGVIQNSDNAVSYYRQACRLGSAVVLREAGYPLRERSGASARIAAGRRRSISRPARNWTRMGACCSGTCTRTGGESTTIPIGRRHSIVEPAEIRKRPCLPSATAGDRTTFETP